jgi:hypothetical protein
MNICHYFVDESGDLALFDKHGRSLIDKGCTSKFFMVGVVQLPDPDSAYKQLEALRMELLADPRLNQAPSMQRSEGKTAHYFHAKDDLPDVRTRVFELLPTFGARVHVAIRRKASLARIAQNMHAYGQKFREDNVYDDLVKRLFKHLLHKADENYIAFARRGKSDRAEALGKAIQKAKSNFEKCCSKYPDKPTQIQSAYPSEYAGLQIIDYYLWALQRMYERQDDSFFTPIASDYKLIMDLDDRRNKKYGEWYTKSKPLSLEACWPTTVA